MAKSNKYWDNRAIRRLTDAEKQSDAYIKRIQKMYDRANRNVQRDIEAVYARYSKKTGMDVQSLKELLTASESDKLWAEMKRKGLDKYVKGNYKARITRLEQIQAQIYAKAKEIYPEEQLQHTKCYEDVINNSYYKAIYDTQMGTGLDFGFSKIDDNMVSALLNENWSGKNYSQRIWGNTDILAESLSEIIGGAMMSGQSIEKTAKQIRDRFGVAKHYAERLVRTETNHFNNEADAMAYDEMGFEQYVFMATLDTRTSTICQGLDNKVIPLKDRQVGVNFPPMHPNCRSKTRAYLGEEIEATLQRRARNPITGKNEVIGNMSYEEWYNSKVKEHGKADVNKAFKKAQNKASDAAQYAKYAERLKGSPYLPKNLESFVESKYNKDDAYKRLAREYRTIGRIDKRSATPERDKQTYYKFRKDDVEITDHGIYDYHSRMHKKDGTQEYDYDKIVDIAKREPNHRDGRNGRSVWVYDGICIVKEVATNEIVSIRKGRVSKWWTKIL